MILVTGASGQFGSKAVDHLLKKGIEASVITALVRDIEKAKNLQDKGIALQVGDYNDHDSLVNAFKGVDKLLLVSSNDRQAIENRTAHHINVIKAAQQAGVKHIVYTSFVRKPGHEDSAIAAFQNSHVQTEIYLKNSGITYTILQNAIYLEMIPVFVGDKVTQNGSIFFPASDGSASYVLREELAEAAAHVLVTTGHENKVYQLTNDVSYTFSDVAAEIGFVLNRNTVYQSPSVLEFESTMQQLGVPDLYIGMFTMWALALSQHTIDTKSDTLEHFIGRKPTRLKQFISQVYHQRD